MKLIKYRIVECRRDARTTYYTVERNILGFKRYLGCTGFIWYSQGDAPHRCGVSLEDAKWWLKVKTEGFTEYKGNT